MIIFQITLSGRMIRTLVDISQGRLGDPSDGHFVSSGRALIREGLVDHELALNLKEPFKFKTKGRTHHWEITPKGRAMLDAIAYDLGDFLAEVTSPTRRAELVEAHWETTKSQHAAGRAQRRKKK